MLTTIRYIGSINTQHRALIGSTQKTVKGSPVTGILPTNTSKGGYSPCWSPCWQCRTQHNWGACFTVNPKRVNPLFEKRGVIMMSLNDVERWCGYVVVTTPVTLFYMRHKTTVQYKITFSGITLTKAYWKVIPLTINLSRCNVIVNVIKL